MPRFSYQVKKSPTEIITGVMEAESSQVVVMRLCQLGYHPLLIEEKGKQSPSFQELSQQLFYRLRRRDLTVFTRQLANLLESGLPLVKALATLVEQTENPRMINIIDALKIHIQDGNTFSQALAQHSLVFSPVYVSLVRAGEAGGMLEEVLERLADLGEKEEELRGRVKAALAYPTLLALVGIATIFVLLTFVLPRFLGMFQEFGQLLPLPTRLLMAASEFMKSYWHLVLGSLGCFFLALRRWGKEERGKQELDRFRLSLPLIGNLIRKVEIAKFSRTLGTLLENGVPVLNALRIVTNTISNKVIAEEVVGMEEKVAGGETLSEQLHKSPHFPALVKNLVAIGEEGGSLEKMLLKIATTYDREVDRAIKTLTSLLEPLMILILGGVVGFIVAAMLLPIFKMNVLVR